MPGWMKPSKVLKTQPDRQMDLLEASRGSARAAALDAKRKGRYTDSGVMRPMIEQQTIMAGRKAAHDREVARAEIARSSSRRAKSRYAPKSVSR